MLGLDDRVLTRESFWKFCADKAANSEMGGSVTPSRQTSQRSTLKMKASTSSKHHLTVMTILRAPLVTSYSDVSLPVLMHAVSFPQLEPGSFKTPAQPPSIQPIEPEEPAKILNQLILHGSDPLDKAIKRVDLELNADKFDEVFQLAFAKLK